MNLIKVGLMGIWKTENVRVMNEPNSVVLRFLCNVRVVLQRV